MYTIYARNVNEAWPIGGQEILSRHILRESRYGVVAEYPTPVITTYTRPEECVLFDPQRNGNPFFHLMETIWMLAGRNDVEWLAQFNSGMKEFSDNGKTFHGAYGYRWRNHFCLGGGDEQVDQVKEIINILKANPHDRRAVLTMWDPMSDLAQDGVDFPCNTHIYFKGRPYHPTHTYSTSADCRLDMTVCCRSNDIIYGCYGSNVVHFSILMQVIAKCIGMSLGTYHHISDSYHYYLEKEHLINHLKKKGIQACPYELNYVSPYLLEIENWETFSADLDTFMHAPHSNSFTNRWFHKVIKPMYWAYLAYKDKNNPDRWKTTLEILNQMPENNDWRKAGQEWIERKRDGSI